MRRLPVFLFVALLLPVQVFAQATISSQHRQLAAEVVELSMGDSMVKSMTDSIKLMNSRVRDQFIAEGGLNERQKAILDQEAQYSIDTLLSPASVAAMRAIYADSYAATYSEAELKGLRDFYLSPAGKAFVAKAPQATAQAVPALQSMMAERMKDFQARAATLQQRIRDAK
jgi:uncharacterized protein